MATTAELRDAIRDLLYDVITGATSLDSLANKRMGDLTIWRDVTLRELRLMLQEFTDLANAEEGGTEIIMQYIDPR